MALFTPTMHDAYIVSAARTPIGGLAAEAAAFAESS